MRFFRSPEHIYEQVRRTLDAAWGLPDGRGTTTCFEPAATAPRDADGLLLLAVADEFCQYTVAVDMLPQLLEAGVVQEISGGDYRDSMNTRII